MTEYIKKWFLANTTPKFRRDTEVHYNLDTRYFIDFVKRSGVEFILNKDLDFAIRYHGSQSIAGLDLISHIISIEIRQNENPIYQEFLTIEMSNN